MFAISILLSVFASWFLCATPQPLFENRAIKLYELGEFSSAGGQMTTFLLPNDTIPLSYTLKMMPNLAGDFSFEGQVIIEVYVKRVSKTIYLHSKNLVIKSAQITKSGSNRNLFPSVALDPDNEMLILESRVDLEQNATYKVDIAFKGTLNDNMLGFYRSSYRVGNTVK